MSKQVGRPSDGEKFHTVNIKSPVFEDFRAWCIKYDMSSTEGLKQLMEEANK
jgi:hypothetical protein